MDRLDGLAAFVAVADLGSFAAAARVQRASPPAITRAIAALEARLGVQLLHRSTRSVRLTEEGSVFLEQCRRILCDLRDVEANATGAMAEPHGTLVVTASQMLGRLHVVPIVTDLMARYPRLNVHLLLLDRPVQLVEEGIDVAVRIGDLPDSGLIAVKVGEVRRVVVASPAYLSEHGTPQTPQDLRSHNIVTFTGISATDEWRFGQAERSVVRVIPRFVVNTANAAIAAVQADAGVCRLLSYQVKDGLGSNRLSLLLEAYEPPATPVNLLFHSARGGSANVRAFINAAKAQMTARLE
jgi:DNA-binding transcriptional LysR family regulator